MTSWWTGLTTINSSDEDIQRRGRTLASLALGLIVVLVLALPLFLSQLNALVSVIAVISSIMLFTVALLLARRGYVTLGALLCVAVVIAAPAGAGLVGGAVRTAPVFFLLAPLIASVVLRPWQIWAATACTIAALIVVALLLSQKAPISDVEYIQIRDVVILAVMTALIGSVASRSASLVLGLVQASRTEAQRSATALEQANAGLEQRVAERTSALADALKAQQVQFEQLQASLTAQRDLNELLAQMSLPILPVHDDVLVAPLVGNIDSARAEQLLSTVLSQVQERRARAIILDVTGVAIVDTHVAQALLRTAEATRLLGAQTILVGIRPEVAQTLVGLGVDMQRLQTAATLQEGLAQSRRLRAVGSKQ